jgi:hypothetical protein
MDGGTASSNYSSAPNNDIIDGGGSIWKCVMATSTYKKIMVLKICV